MCNMVVLPRGVRVTPEIRRGLELAADVNYDGSGFGIVTPEAVITGRDLDSYRLIADFVMARDAFPGGAAVFHSRLATAKKAALLHVHPFYAGGGRYLFFNGSMPGLEEKTRSDARVLAEDLMPHLSPADLGDMIGRQNKAVILQPGRPRDPQCFVANRSQWLDGPDGTIWSNADYLGRGAGWDETMIDGELYRFSVPQPGDCPRCHMRGHGNGMECTEPRAAVPYRWRNETKRIAGLT